MTVVDTLLARLETQPRQRFLRFDEGDMSYEELFDAASRVAASMAAIGVGAGERVATIMGNGPDAVVVWFGLTLGGLVEVPINTALRGRLLREQLEASGVKLVVADESGRAAVTELGTTSVGGVVAPRELLGDDRAVPVPHSDLDLAVILYTSGTTGRSKGVMLNHRATMRLSRAIVDHTGLGRDDVLFTAFPLFHIAARFVSVAAAMLVGGTVVVHRRFSASRFWDICRGEGVTAIHYLGTLPMMLWQQERRDDDARNPVRLAYGAGLPAGIHESFEHRYGLVAYELYGSTEQGVAAMTRDGARRAGTCGRVVDDIDLEIHDEEDRPLPPGTAGEIVVRPRRPGILFDGYDAMPDATVESWRNLWFHTGDLGTLDDDGFLVFGGRIKDAIRRRGENISSWEVERALLSCPGVVDAAAVGVPSDLGEEEVLVVVVPDGPGLTPEAVAEHCAAELPAYAVPRYVRMVDALPRTPSDRVKKYVLRRDGVTSGTWDREGSLR